MDALGLKGWIRGALSTENERRGRGKKLDKVVREPSQKAIDRVMLIMVVLGMLVLLEVVHIVALGTFNEAIFQAIASVVGALLGFFFGYKA